MTLKEMKLMADAIEKRFTERYKEIDVAGKRCFMLNDGRCISVCCISSYNALVIEYADSYEEATLNRFEDGDLFYLDNLDEDAAFQSMISEIEQ